MATMNAAWNLQNNPELQKAAKNYQAHLNWVNKQKVNQRGTLQKYAPAAGATAGALLAAVLTRGASIAPTMAILGASGAIGGGAGEAYAQKSNRENFNLGRIRNEALVSGATSAIPVGGFGRSARIASQAGKSTAAAGAEQVVGKGLLGKFANSGRRLETRAGGYGIGNSKPGTPPIDIFNQRKIQTTLRSEGIKPGHPEDLAINAQVKLKNYHQQMDRALAQNNTVFKPKEIGQIQRDYLSKINSSATVDDNIRRYATQFSTNLKNVKDLRGLNNFRKELDKKAISWIANPDATTAAKTEAARTLRSQLSEIIGSKAPALKAVNTKYSNLSQASDFLTKESGVLTKQSQNAGAGLTGRLMTGDIASTAKSKIGATMQKVAGVGPNAAVKGGAGAGLLRPTAGEMGKQSLTQAILDSVQAKGSDPYAPQPAAEVNPATNTPNGPYDPNYVASPIDPTADPNAPMDAQQQAPESPYSLQQALADIQRDPKNTEKYLSVYKTVAAAQEEAGGGKMTAAQQKQLMGNATASQLINQIEGNLQGLPSGRLAGFAAQIAGKAGFSDKVNAYEAQRPALALMLIKAIQGSAGQISDADRNAIQASIPSVHDTAGEQRQKLATLRGVIQAYQGAASANYSSTDSLQEALLQLQGGQ